jgi:hypothetical protein
MLTTDAGYQAAVDQAALDAAAATTARAEADAAAALAATAAADAVAAETEALSLLDAAANKTPVSPETRDALDALLEGKITAPPAP